MRVGLKREETFINKNIQYETLLSFEFSISLLCHFSVLVTYSRTFKGSRKKFDELLGVRVIRSTKSSQGYCDSEHFNHIQL